MICKQCQQNVATGKFCSHCGAALIPSKGVHLRWILPLMVTFVTILAVGIVFWVGSDKETDQKFGGSADPDVIRFVVADEPNINGELDEQVFRNGTTVLDGRHIASAEASFHEGQYLISLSFTDEGATLLQQITTQYINEYMAIFVNDRLVSAPIIQSSIDNGEAVISGLTQQEAKEIAHLINSTITSHDKA